MGKLAILGGGESGIGAAILAYEKGYQIFVSDHKTIAEPYRRELIERGIQFEEGKHSLHELIDAREIVKSPGISSQLPIIKELQAAGIPLIDEIELASRYTNAFIIAITGSNGKSTTTHLAYHLLQKAGFKVAIAGNMGESFAKKVALEKHDYYVLELSSFQLENLPTFKPNIAAIINITSDHLDRYNHDMAAYAAAKLRILHNMDQQGICIYNADDELLSTSLQAINKPLQWYPLSLKERDKMGGYLLDDSFYFKPRAEGHQTIQIPAPCLPLAGRHNSYNAMIAIAICNLLGVESDRIIRGLKTFKTLRHRLEWVGNINGADFYNDSKATNVASALVALESFNKPLIWIAGGYDKGNDYTPLYSVVKRKVKAIIGLAKDNTAIKQAFGEQGIPMYETHSMQATIDIAVQLAGEKEVVLLSPACSSLDLFRNFEDRGDQFAHGVKQHIKKSAFEKKKHVR